MTINNIDDNRFSINGRVFFKNFMSDIHEDKLRIFNVYDTRFQLIPFTSFDEFTVDGVTFVNVEDLQTTLATLLYVRNLSGGGGTPTTGERDGLIIGTSEHIGNYQYRFIAQQYRINGTLYNTVLNTVITFDPADPTNDRIDLVIIQLVGGIPQISVIKGTPADPASKPVLQNVQTQIEFTIITVKGGTTAPVDVTSLLVYDEFAQEVGGEFNCTTASNFIFPLDETDPYEGVRDIWFNGTPAGDNIIFSSSTPITTAGRNLILKFKQRVVQNYSFEIDLGGNPLLVQGSSFGLDPFSTEYQSLIIPLSYFVDTSFQNIRITNRINGADFFIDKVELQSGGSVPLEGYMLRGGYTGTGKDLYDLIMAISGVDLSDYQLLSEKGAALGYTPLGNDQKVPAQYLPSYVDDVIDGYYNAPTFYSDVAETIPIVAETGKIYIDLKTNRSYRWSGSAYARVDDFDLTAALSNAPAKAVPIGADRIPLLDSVTGFLRNFTLTNLVNYLQAIFDQRYRPLHDRLVKKLDVSGTYAFDLLSGETWRLTMVGNTAFSIGTKPPANFTGTVTGHLNGDFAPTWSAELSQYKTGSYDGTKLNTLVIEYVEGDMTKFQISQND